MSVKLQGQRLSAAEMEARLAGTELFGALDGQGLHEVASELEWVQISGGEPLFHQGDVGDGLYIVMSGRLRVIIERGGGIEEAVAEMGRGEMVGEMAVLTDERRSATVCAVRDTELVKFSAQACHRVAEKHPRVLFHIARVVALRLEAMNRAQRRPTCLTNIALVPIGPEVALPDFAASLAAAMAELGATLHLDSRRFDTLWREQGIAQTPANEPLSHKIAHWLNDQENEYRFVLYETDARPSHWTRRCIRQADRILLVGNGESSPTISPLETELLLRSDRRSTARMELVLVQPDEVTLGADTRKWLEVRQVSRHYHVRRSSAGDFQRLARLLTGQAFGLALGGGGVRGFAHIGAIRAIKEAAIPIDFIGGTSMGSLVAAQYALGWDEDRMLELNRRMFRETWPLNDYTVPVIACLAGQKFDKTLKSIYDVTQVEDLLLNFFCISTNLTTAALVIHQDGMLWKRVRASCSLPGILPPEFDQGDMLVDGAVLNNVPGDVMKRLCGGSAVAVDVSPQEDTVFRARYAERPMTRKILWGQVNPFAQKISMPTLFDIVSRAAMLSSISSTSRLRDRVDLYLHIPLEQFGMSESRSFDEIVDIGYQAAREQIKEWKAGKQQ